MNAVKFHQNPITNDRVTLPGKKYWTDDKYVHAWMRLYAGYGYEDHSLDCSQWDL